MLQATDRIEEISGPDSNIPLADRLLALGAVTIAHTRQSNLDAARSGISEL